MKLEITVFDVFLKGPVYLNVQTYQVEKIEDRGLDFSEQRAHWSLPQFFHTNLVTDIAVKKKVKPRIFLVLNRAP